MTIVFRLSIVVFIASICRSQAVTPTALKSGDLRADAAILRRAYEQLHPGLYRYSSKQEMDADFTALDDQLAHDQSLQDAFLAFSEFAAKVRCGHTQANPFNQSKSLIEALFKSPTRLPFYFTWIDDRMIVTRDFTPARLLPAGTEVTQIDGVGTAALLKKLLSVTRADGANDGKPIAQLAVNGDSMYETFDLYYPLFFPQKGTIDTLWVRKPGRQKSERLIVNPLTLRSASRPSSNVRSSVKAEMLFCSNGSTFPMEAPLSGCQHGRSTTVSGTGSNGSTSTWTRRPSETHPH